MIERLGFKHKALHTAGNDVHYALQNFIAMAVDARHQDWNKKLPLPCAGDAILVAIDFEWLNTKKYQSNPHLNITEAGLCILDLRLMADKPLSTRMKHSRKMQLLVKET